MLDGSPGLEAVIIATPHHLHAPMSLGMSLLNTN
jgi:predicted dehydrogenase